MEIGLAVTINYRDILAALDITEIPGVDLGQSDKIQFDPVILDSDAVMAELRGCRLLPEVSRPEFNAEDIVDGFKYIALGQITLATAMFARLFDGDNDVIAAMERAMLECFPARAA